MTHLVPYILHIGPTAPTPYIYWFWHWSWYWLCTGSGTGYVLVMAPFMYWFWHCSGPVPRLSGPLWQ